MLYEGKELWQVLDEAKTGANPSSEDAVMFWRQKACTDAAGMLECAVQKYVTLARSRGENWNTVKNDLTELLDDYLRICRSAEDRALDSDLTQWSAIQAQLRKR